MTAGIDTDRLRGLVRQRLLGPDSAVRIGDLSPPQRRVAVRGAVLDVLNEQRVILSEGSLAAVMNQVSDEVVGFGPIERLLKDPEVSEVMVNGADDVYVERKGRRRDHRRTLGPRAVSPWGGRVLANAPRAPVEGHDRSSSLEHNSPTRPVNPSRTCAGDDASAIIPPCLSSLLAGWSRFRLSSLPRSRR